MSPLLLGEGVLYGNKKVTPLVIIDVIEQCIWEWSEKSHARIKLSCVGMILDILANSISCILLSRMERRALILNRNIDDRANEYIANNTET